MRYSQRGERRYVHFETLGVPGLVHAISTRPQDISARVDADSGLRDARRRQMVQDFGLDPRRLRYCVQVHQDNVLHVKHDTPCGPQEGYDAVVTAERDAILMNFSADCPLLLVFDPRNRVIAQAHASWRCTVAGIARKVVTEMRERYGCRADELRAAIGPSAGPCCYEVKEDVREAARTLEGAAELFPQRDGRMYFDLWRANRNQLAASGINAINIEIAGICTMCRNDMFFSFRREGAGCGHFALMAALAD